MNISYIFMFILTPTTTRNFLYFCSQGDGDFFPMQGKPHFALIIRSHNTITETIIENMIVTSKRFIDNLLIFNGFQPEKVSIKRAQFFSEASSHRMLNFRFNFTTIRYHFRSRNLSKKSIHSIHYVSLPSQLNLLY